MKAQRTVSIILLVCLSFFFVSCDVSARWDLKRAEKLLKEADRVNAEFWAEKEYRKAQKAFEEAMDLARSRKINEARDLAAKAKDCAEEAVWWAKVRAEEMEREKAGINSKKY